MDLVHNERRYDPLIGTPLRARSRPGAPEQAQISGLTVSDLSGAQSPVPCVGFLERLEVARFDPVDPIKRMRRPPTEAL